MVPEAPLEATDTGLVPAGPGWFALDVGEARWIRRPGRGHIAPLTGWTDEPGRCATPGGLLP